MKKLVSLSLFVAIILLIGAVHSAQAQGIVRAGFSGPGIAVAAGPRYYAPHWGFRPYRAGLAYRPVAGWYGRPMHYRRARFGFRARVW